MTFLEKFFGFFPLAALTLVSLLCPALLHKFFFFQNYNRPPVMALAVPVAVKFLQRGNKELCRNMSSYLSLAAIAKAELLAEHTETILSSVLQGRPSPGFSPDQLSWAKHIQNHYLIESINH